MDILRIEDRLKAPFPKEKIHWRIGSTNQRSVARKTNNPQAKATKGMPLAYIDARDVMDRLDEVVGPSGWEDSYKETSSGRVICELGVDYGGGCIRYKSDGAGATDFEGDKGALSDAFKRAAVKHGIGRYLYGIKSGWVDLDEWGKFQEPEIKVLPRLRIDRELIQRSLIALLDHLDQKDPTGLREVTEELDEYEISTMWKLLSTNQQQAIKLILHNAKEVA